MDRGETANARAHLDALAARQPTEVRAIPYRAYAEALVHSVDGEHSVGVDIVHALEYELGGYPLTSFCRGLLATAKAELHIAARRPERALTELVVVNAESQHGLCPCSVRARALLTRRDYDACLDTVRPCLDIADEHAPRTMLDVLVTAAAAQLCLRDVDRAVESFVRALSLAAVTGGRRAFLLLPKPTLRALLAHAQATDPGPAGSTVCERLAAMVAPRELRSTGPALSPRERLVLSYLATGASTKEIAEQLYVSPNTLKTQLRSTYRKLSVGSREEALERARATGLL